jgi:2-haloacid dehalogenase
MFVGGLTGEYVALAAGCRAALVQRPGVVASPLGAQPDIIGPTLTEIVDQILAEL